MRNWPAYSVMTVIKKLLTLLNLFWSEEVTNPTAGQVPAPGVAPCIQGMPINRAKLAMFSIGGLIRVSETA